MLSADEARQLDELTLCVGTPPAAPAPAGFRVARARGRSGEIQDVRPYEPGDDPRLVEWTIYARLNQLVTRTHRTDAHLRVHVLVDVSRSMGVGSPGKVWCATRVAAMLAYVAIRGRDAVGVTTFADAIAYHVAPAAGRLQLLRAMQVLAEASAAGRSAIGRVLMDYGGVERGPGLVVVISDFFDPEEAFAGLHYLLHRGLTPVVVQIVAPEELDPGFTDDAELVDIEEGDDAPLLADGATIAAYKTALAVHWDALGEFCREHGLPCMRLVSSDSFTGLLRVCHDAGLLAGQR